MAELSTLHSAVWMKKPHGGQRALCVYYFVFSKIKLIRQQAYDQASHLSSTKTFSRDAQSEAKSITELSFKVMQCQYSIGLEV